MKPKVICSQWKNCATRTCGHRKFHKKCEWTEQNGTKVSCTNWRICSLTRDFLPKIHCAKSKERLEKLDNISILGRNFKRII